jgi:hypothetical protein
MGGDSNFTRDEENRILTAWTSRSSKQLAQSMTLEDMMTGPFRLGTATDLQRAICRLVDGTPLGPLAKHPDVLAYVGNVYKVDGVKPDEIGIFSGIRTFKSLLAAAVAVHASQTCNVSHLGPGETPRVSIVSLSKDLATVVFRHLVGNIKDSELKEILIGDPTADTVMLRHPTGIAIEVKVVAGARAGASLVNRWSAGAIFDEASRMVGQDVGVVNYNDAHDSVKGRLLPGAQIISIGSPWAPLGPAYEIVQEHWLKPSKDMICIKAPAYALNPVWWTSERCAALKKSDPDVYRTDVEAEFLEPESSMFSLVEINASTRDEITIPYEEGLQYSAAMDPATRSNDWTFAIATQRRNGKKSIVYNCRWQGSKSEPLSPDAVLYEIAKHCQAYRVDIVRSDQYAGDALRDIARRHGVNISIEPWTSQNKYELFNRCATELSDELLELPPDPILKGDLISVRRRVVQNGISVVLPRTSDGRHGDYAPCVVMALARFLIDPVALVPQKGTVAYINYLADQDEIADDESFLNSQRQSWAERRVY